eukprot:XP_015580348.1 uncharacterized protein LOC8265731 isoform X2 [Ricinus communis]
MWYRTKLSSRWNIRKFCTAARRRIDDEGDWFYSSEWWGTDSSSSSSNGHTVLRSTSNRGNGVVSVVAYPSSRPSKVDWPKAEKWFSQRYAEMHPVEEHDVFRIVGYQWRTLRFNDDTRQSTAKVMAAYHQSLPNSIFLMQQSHCLAVPCAMIHIVEIDPLVISASVQAMGFPAFSVMASPDQRALSKPSIMDEIMWRGIHERLYLYESDAENFVLNSSNLYDMIFIDAYDGDDIFPRKLWDADSPFLNALKDRLHPEHGTVVVNLHADYEAFSPHPSVSYFNQQLLPMSKHVRKVCRAYKDILTGDGNSCGEKQGSGFVFTVAVPWVCNTSMVVCRGLGMSNRFSSRDSIANAVISKSLEVENILNLPFSCFEYIKRDFTLID